MRLGVAESDGAGGAEVGQQKAYSVQPFVAFDFVPALFDLAVAVLSLDLDGDRFSHELRAEFGNALGVGGRKQQGLALFRTLLGDFDDVVEEAHVEHAVGFVEHQGVERIELQAAALQVVHQAAGRADHDVGAVLQRGELSTQRHAAAERDDLDVVFGARQSADFGGHLIGQLARGAEHHGLHGEAARVQVGQQGQGKGGGLAAAGLGLGNDVFAQQGRRQAGRLDRRHGRVAQLLQVGQRGRGEGEGGEVGRGSGGHPRLSVAGARNWSVEPAITPFVVLNQAAPVGEKVWITSLSINVFAAPHVHVPSAVALGQGHLNEPVAVLHQAAMAVRAARRDGCLRTGTPAE